jgi:hypothetical protein
MKVVKVSAEKTSKRVEDVRVTTFTPSVKPVSLGILVHFDLRA